MPLPSNLQTARDLLNRKLDEFGVEPPRVGLVTGSGLAALAESAEIDFALGFDEIPGLSAGRVQGHPHRWSVGRIGGVPLHLVAGRRHLYEGVTGGEAVHAIRLMALLGAKLIVLTNAAGGLSRRLRPGDLMLIDDQINFSFNNPLIGPNVDELGPRFPDMSRPYHRAAMAILRRAAAAEKIDLKTGVYAGVLGPNFETRAEVGMLRRLGADCVGMSTVAETVAAAHAGVQVAAISLITNSHVISNDSAAGPTSHEEVLQRGREGQERFTRLVTRALPGLAGFATSPMLGAAKIKRG